MDEASALRARVMALQMALRVAVAGLSPEAKAAVRSGLVVMGREFGDAPELRALAPEEQRAVVDELIAVRLDFLPATPR